MKRYQKPIKISLISLVSIIAGFILYVLISILWASKTYYQPEKIEQVASFNTPDTLMIDTVYNMFSWNIGYACLGKDMDFFYDGGVKVRDEKENVKDNLTNITQQLNTYISKVTFAMVQEVDLNSKRSYSTNQVKEICGEIDNCVKTFALNYYVRYIPVPYTNPMGKVKSGLLNVSKPVPLESNRYGFEKQYSWPKKVFMLNRCFLVNRYKLNNGKNFVLVNIHNSAFDEGELRKDQILTIRSFVLNEFQKGNYVIVGGDWNQYPPNFEPQFPEYLFFSGNIPLSDTLMPKDWTWAYDPTIPTNRDLSAPLTENTKTQVIDFFLASPNIEVVAVKGNDLGFEYTDHNPVFLRFRMQSK